MVKKSFSDADSVQRGPDVRKFAATLRALGRRPIAMTIASLLGISLVFWLIQENANVESPHASVDDLIRELKDKDIRTRYRAAGGLRSLGLKAEPAIPALIESMEREALSDNDAVFHEAKRTLTSLGLPAVHAMMKDCRAHPNQMVRVILIQALGDMGLEAQPAIPVLQAALADEEVGLYAAYALWQIDPQCKLILPAFATEVPLPIPTLIGGLRHKNDEVSQRAASLIEAIGPDAREAVPALVEALDRERVGPAVLRALNRMPRSNEAMAAVPSLARALRDEHEHLGYNREAIEVLAQLRSEDPLAVSGLAGALKDSDIEVRRLAAGALADLGQAGLPALPALLDLVHHPDDRDLWCTAINSPKELIKNYPWPARTSSYLAAAYALGRIPSGRERVLPILLRQLKGSPPASPMFSLALAPPSSQLRSEAASAIGLLGAAAAKEGIPALAGALNDKSEEVRQTAVWALGELGPAGVPGLLSVLKNVDPEIRLQPAEVLGTMGPTAAEAVPALTDALKEDFPLHGQALLALARIEAASPDSRDRLLQLLKDPRYPSSARARAAEIWRQRSLPVDPILPLCDAILAEKDPAVCHGIILIIDRANPPSKAAVPFLCRAAKSSNRYVSIPAIEALGRLRGLAADAVDTLRGALSDPVEYTRCCAAHALGQIGPEARAALPELAELLDEDPSPTARTVSMRAISAFGSDGAAALPALCSLVLEGRNDTEALAALSRFNRSPAFVLPAPLLGWEDYPWNKENPDERRGTISEHAIRVLATMGPAAKDAAIPVLLLALRDERLTVRLAAAHALQKIDPEAAAAEHMSAQELDAAWESLGETDLTPAYQGAWALIADPAIAIPYLRDQLAKAPPARALKHDRTPADLRVQRATAILERIGTPEARQVLQNLKGGSRPTR